MVELFSQGRVVFVPGPTASGKSEMALAWAEAFGGVIVNCDSVQVFQGVDIGSAKPSLEEQKRRPHFLYDHVPRGGVYTAGQYRRDFMALLPELIKKYRWIFVVGGTGFYFQALEKGMYEIGPADPEVTRSLEIQILKPQGALLLHQELRLVDPESAEKISPQDHYRLIRALEIYRTHGQTMSELRNNFEKNHERFPAPLLKVGVWAERKDLEERVFLRTKKMLDHGLVAEVVSLLRQSLESWRPLQSVGYQEVKELLLAHPHRWEELLENRWPPGSKEKLIQEIAQNTLRLAKRQRTWFRRDKEIQWISYGEIGKGCNIISQWDSQLKG